MTCRHELLFLAAMMVLTVAIIVAGAQWYWIALALVCAACGCGCRALRAECERCDGNEDGQRE